MPIQADFKKYLKRIEGKWPHLFAIGVSDVYVWDENGFLGTHENCFKECLAYVFTEKDFEQDDLILSEPARTDTGMQYQLLYFGPNLTRNILDKLTAGGVSTSSILNPFAGDCQMLTNVLYKNVEPKKPEGVGAIVKKPSVNNISKNSCSLGGDGDLQISNEETDKTELRRKRIRSYERVVRRKDVFGKISRDKEIAYSFKSKFGSSSKPMQWICEVHVPNVASSILEYETQQLKSRKIQSEPGISVQLKLDLLVKYEEYTNSVKKDQKSVLAWLNSPKSKESNTARLIKEIFDLHTSQYAKNANAIKGERAIIIHALGSAIKAARTHRSQQKGKRRNA